LKSLDKLGIAHVAGLKILEIHIIARACAVQRNGHAHHRLRLGGLEQRAGIDPVKNR
jgi:hypothetical protein